MPYVCVIPPPNQDSEASVSQKANAIVVQGAPAILPEERRASVRYRSDAKGSCQTLSVRRETSWNAIVRDISPEGIGLLLARRFEPGVLVAIELTAAGDDQTRLLLARVAHATARPEGDWLVGCTLVSPLTNDEIQALR
jgi:hypothetical protein